jgi:hypothetical protein
MNVDSGGLWRQLCGRGRPLGELAGARLRAAPNALAALALERATRDRLVIFDPAMARLIRPLVLPEDLAAWHVTAADRWVVAVPESDAATVPALPALARHLNSLPVPPHTSPDQPWWALPDAIAVIPPPPYLIVAGDAPTVAWHPTPALVAGPAALLAPADPYWLALLGSALGLALLRAGPLAEFPVAEAPGPAQANLAGLALAAANLAAQIDTLERAVLRRLLADFAPPGVSPGPLLRRWWQLDFAALHAAVNSELRNDIPERFRPTWAQIHNDQCATHNEASTRLASLAHAIDTQVAALYGLSNFPF